ncbi:Uncharacterised protein [Moraxella equi]|uniref:Uncharacterized protein n=1 Tax=Moraxella equi TaxID=60442 RepID=A0A378QNR9_9GAMM|nr:Uncharacterised protein [Moraxella equi]STZ02505.1 Uncharacterised protein [Moraxella equi]STZ02517.1 Uncharacterised protein [Moraxella equi]
MKGFLLDELDYFNRIVLYSNTLDKWIDKKKEIQTKTKTAL